jgi:uncharacterized protein (DUF1697 family)
VTIAITRPTLRRVEHWLRMGTHVALLRGINVGGRNVVPMAELRTALAELGLENVRTLIQSGNVVFESSSKAGLAERIAGAVDDAFGVRPGVVLRTPAELEDVVRSSPFADTAKLHVVFLEKAPRAAAARALDPDRSPPDAFALVRRDLYVHLPSGAGRTKLTIGYVERTLGVRGTQRNWKTVLGLVALARE